MPGASRPDRRARVNDASAIQASSMEVWPAAGGGLLLGMIVPALAGAVSLRLVPRSAGQNLDCRARAIVGFSRMAGADQDRTLARLRALRSDLIDPTVAVYNGRVVKRTARPRSQAKTTG
jgi:hypothetical protein